ncbi:MAG: hypothetical protein ACK4TF_09665 [Thermodesulfovibrionales bacterium]
MATVKNIDYRKICEDLYAELDTMKERLSLLVEKIDMLGPELKERFRPVVRHLDEIINTIEWKMEIFTKVCPFDFSGYHREVESGSSIPLVEKTKEFSSGYIGG